MLNMAFEERLVSAQQSLDRVGFDGWLIYDFRRSNDLACRFLDIPSNMLFTRRFFYWIPRTGIPIKLLHRIESNSLDHLPGKVMVYSTWKELENGLKSTLSGSHKVAMEYSPKNAIPYVSKVDAGTIDLIRSFDIDVVSSANLLQMYSSTWDDQQLELHLAAAKVVDHTVNNAWEMIALSLKQGKKLTEMDIQQFILKEFHQEDCITDDPPICAFNAHSALPHYGPNPHTNIQLKEGDFILIDLSCKKNVPRAVYADITRVGVADSIPTPKQQEVFEIVRRARDAAMEFLISHLALGNPIMGCDVDEVCRQKIVEAGYGDYFTHRTGHNLGERVHGDGANIDNYETQDTRLLLPRSCFTIEPGIYLPNEFGVRLEHDVYLEADRYSLRVTGCLQNEMICLL